MKQTSPIRRHQALVSFSKDHHFGLLLVWKIRQGLNNAVSPERISKYVLYFFEKDLKHHFKEEEQLIFSKLSTHDVLRQQAEKEHAMIYSLVEKIEQDRSNETLLIKLADTLQAHIRFEERTLFAHMQQQLSVAELETISTYESNSSAEVDLQWDDVFWQINKSGL